MKWTSFFMVIGLGTFIISCAKKNSSIDVTTTVTIAEQKVGKEKDDFRFIVTPEIAGTNDIGERIIYLTGHCVITEGHKIDSIAFYEGNNMIDANHYLVTEPVIDGAATHTVLAYKQPGTYSLTAVAIDKHGSIIKTAVEWYNIE
jgi:hypothetical protein